MFRAWGEAVRRLTAVVLLGLIGWSLVFIAAYLITHTIAFLRA